MTSADFKFSEDHFALFGLKPVYAIDFGELERRYLDIQTRVHPDKHAHLTDADRRVAMQWATRVNEAYQVLRNPLQRAHYLLTLMGHDPQVEHNTAMAPEFLMAQMEWREEVASARESADADGLDRLHRRLRDEMKAQYGDLACELDQRFDYAAAAEKVRQLMFQEKLLQEIEEALEAIGA